jgi:NagD protein
MVGDNMDTDIIAGVQAGLTTALVLSGVSQVEDIARYAYRPNHIIKGIGDLIPLLDGPHERRAAGT